MLKCIIELTDTQGKSLCMGDIIESSNQHLHYVDYSKEEFGFYFRPLVKNDYHYHGRHIRFNTEFHDMKIVGNIKTHTFDNNFILIRGIT